jgi:hypothetical protein
MGPKLLFHVRRQGAENIRVAGHPTEFVPLAKIQLYPIEAIRVGRSGFNYA